MYILAGMLVIGFLCNLLVKRVDERYYMRQDEIDPAAGGARRSA